MSSTTRKLRRPCEHTTSTCLPSVCFYIRLCVHHVRVRCVEELKWEHIARWVSHWAIHVTRNLQIPVMGKRWPRGAPSLRICTSMLWHNSSNTSRITWWPNVHKLAAGLHKSCEVVEPEPPVVTYSVGSHASAQYVSLGLHHPLLRNPARPKFEGNPRKI